jgi:nucleoside-diphosphate kinase
MERTLVLIKPDALQRGLIGEIIRRLENKGLRMVAAQLMKMDRIVAENHYGEHRGKDFFEPTVAYMSKNPLLAMIWEGPDAIRAVRKLAGPTNGAAAESGTIRGDYSLSNRYNLIHASDGPESAARGIKLFFPAGEFFFYPRIEDSFAL